MARQQSKKQQQKSRKQQQKSRKNRQSRKYRGGQNAVDSKSSLGSTKYGGQLNLGAIGPATASVIKAINPLSRGGRRRR